jgi:hypothetical protein
MVTGPEGNVVVVGVRPASRVGFPPVNVPKSALPPALEALVEHMRRHNPEPEITAD